MNSAAVKPNNKRRPRTDQKAVNDSRNAKRIKKLCSGTNEDGSSCNSVAASKQLCKKILRLAAGGGPERIVGFV
jgi:hypothetical protein